MRAWAGRSVGKVPVENNLMIWLLRKTLSTQREIQRRILSVKTSEYLTIPILVYIISIKHGP